MPDVHSNYPDHGESYAAATHTASPRGYVGLLVSDTATDSYSVIHFTPKRARKLARQIVKAADTAQADLDAGCTA